MNITRINRFGLAYGIAEVEGGVRVTLPMRESVKELEFPGVTIAQMNQGWYDWMMRGLFTQDAFPFLTADQREFLMTGILPEEFAELVKEREW